MGLIRCNNEYQFCQTLTATLTTTIVLPSSTIFFILPSIDYTKSTANMFVFSVLGFLHSPMSKLRTPLSQLPSSPISIIPELQSQPCIFPRYLAAHLSDRGPTSHPFCRGRNAVALRQLYPTTSTCTSPQAQLFVRCSLVKYLPMLPEIGFFVHSLIPFTP